MPGSVNVTTGFCALDNVPLLNSQFQVVGLPVEISVNCTLNGAHPVVTSEVKFATGDCAKTQGVPAKAIIKAIIVFEMIVYILFLSCAWFNSESGTLHPAKSIPAGLAQERRRKISTSGEECWLVRKKITVG